MRPIDDTLSNRNRGNFPIISGPVQYREYADFASLPDPTTFEVENGHVWVQINSPSVALYYTDGASWNKAGSSVAMSLETTFTDNIFTNTLDIGNVTNSIFMKLTPGATGTALSWYQSMYSGANGGTADYNIQMGLGWNQGATGAIDPSLPSGGWRFESHYQPAGDWIMENHTAVFIDPAAPGTEIRAFDTAHNFTTNKTQTATQCNQFFVEPPGGGSGPFEVDVDANVVRYIGSAIAEFEVNNVPIVKQRNHTNNAFVGLIQLNATDQVELGELGAALDVVANGELKSRAGFSIHTGQDFEFLTGGNFKSQGNVWLHVTGGGFAGDVTLGRVGNTVDINTTHLRLNPTGNLQFFGTGGGTTQASGASMTDCPPVLKTYLQALGIIGA